MRVRPPDAQIASVLEAKDVDGKSLVASAAEGGSLAVLQRVVTVLGGEVRAWACEDVCVSVPVLLLFGLLPTCH